MSRESYEFADLTNSQLDQLLNVENTLNKDDNKDVIILAFTKA